jgi:mycofactocin glycosyltransferase
VLPAGWRVVLDPGTRRIDDGTVLVGGSPLRLLRLSPAGARFVDGLAGGGPVGATAGGQRLARRLLDAGIAHPRPDRTLLTTDDVTVVVPVRDRPDGLTATLAHLGPAGAVIVVDDGSDGEATAEVGRRAGAEVIRHDISRGPAAARNTGWRQATTDFVAFVDAECEPADGWLDSLLPHFSDPSVAAVAPRIATGTPERLPGPVAAYELARPTLDRGPMEAPVRPRSRVPFVPTAAIIVRRAALVELVGFDEAMRVGEDVDLVWRLGQAGWTVRYAPSVMVSHPSRPTVPAWLRQRFDYGTSAAPLARRHGPAVAPLSVSPWTAASWGLVGLGAPIAGTALGAASTALLAPRLRGLRHPWQESARLAGLGHLYGGRAVADAVRRAWWPLALLAALRWRRPRVGVALAIAVPSLIEWWHERPPLDPATWSLLRLVDDVVYGAGVWAGCWHERSLAALRPELTNWPGRRPAVEPAAESLAAPFIRR